MGEQKLYSAIKSGRAFNDAERDRGTIIHLLTTDHHPSWSKSLCGTSPGSRGNGWHYVTDEVNCTKCIKKSK